MNSGGKFELHAGFGSSAHGHIDSLSKGADSFTVPDAHLLFSGDYARSGADLIISDHLQRVVVSNYFHGDKRPALVSPEGAPLDPKVIDALTGHVKYAQAGTVAAAKVVGHVVKMTGSASIVRNGVTIDVNNGDNVYQNDVVQTGSGSTLGLVMIDGTTFNLTANARLMMNDLTYDATSTSNTSLFTLVQGAATFVAGQVAKTGDMKVSTPVATMGIRGTAVILDINAIDGTVSISVVNQRDGQIHAVQVFNARGDLIGTVTSNGTSLTLRPTATFEVIAQESNKTVAQVLTEFNAFQQLLSTYEIGKQLVPSTPAPTDGRRGDNTQQSLTKFAGSTISPIDSTNTKFNADVGGTKDAKGGAATDDAPKPTGGIADPTTKVTVKIGDDAPIQVEVAANSIPFVVTPSPVSRISSGPGDHFGPVMSADGQFVTYDPDGAIYLFDRKTGATKTIASPGEGFTYGSPTISSDGHFVVYQGSDGTRSWIFIYNNDASDPAHYGKITQLMSGGQAAISGDGSKIVVERGGSIGLYDQQGHELANITAAAVGITGTLWKPAISADGHIIAFWSSNSSSPGAAGQLFTYDLSSATVRSIASTATGAGNSAASFSADGHYVVYQSDAPDGHSEIYLYDLQTRQVVFHTANLDPSYNPVLSPDGHFIILASDAKLTTDDKNSFTDIYVIDVTDLSHPAYKLVSVLDDGTQGDDASNLGAAISAGGQFVAFGSRASNFSSHDTPGTGDIFVVDPTSGHSAIILESRSSPAMLGASGVIKLTGDHSGITLGASDSRLTASFDSNGDIQWSFSEPRSDFASLQPGQISVQNFVITLRTARSTTEIPVKVSIYDVDQPVVSVADAAPVASPVTLATGTEDTSYTISSAALLAGVVDIDGPSLSITAVGILSGGGGIVDNHDGTFRYTPAPNYHGPVVFSYTASDGTLSASSTATLDLAAVNDAPSVTRARFAVSEGGTVVLNAAAIGVADPDSASFTFTVSNVTHGKFQTTANGGTWVDAATFTAADLTAGHVRFVHDGGEGAPTFSIQADDGAALNHLSATVAGAVDFANVNDAPTVSSAVTGGGAEGSGPAAVNLLDFASDADPGAVLHVANLVWTDTGSGSPAGFALSPDGNSIAVDTNSLAYNSLAQGETFTTHFGYDVVDEHGASVHQTAAVTIAGTNDAPTITSAALSILEGGTVVLGGASIGVTDPDSTSLTFAVSNVSHGAFQVTSDGIHWTNATAFTTADLSAGHVRFMHDGGELAPTFSIQANDGAASNNQSNVLAGSVSFTHVNDAPVVATAALTIPEGGTVVLGASNVAVTDPDNNSFVFTTSNVSHGTFEITTNGSTWVPVTTFTIADLNSGHVRFVHDGSEDAPTFSLQANDGTSSNSLSNVLAGTVTFTNVNDAPVAVADTGVSITQNGGVPVSFSSILNASATGVGSEYVITQAINTQVGALWSDSKISLNTSFTISAELFFGANDGGADGFSFIIQNQSKTAIGQVGGGLGYQGIGHSVAIEFDTFYNGPTFNDILNDHAAFDINGSMNGVGAPIDLGNIEDGQYHPVTIDWNAATHVITLSYDGVVIGARTIDVAATVGNNEAYVGFAGSTGAANNLQKLRNLSYQSADNSVVLDVLANDTDVDPGDKATLHVVSTSSASGATLAFSGLAGAGIVYSPGDAFKYLAAGHTATDTVTYTIEDSHGAQATSTAQVTIVGLNDAPVFSGTAAGKTFAVNGFAVAVAANVVASDIDSDSYNGGSLTATVTQGGHQGDTLGIANSQYIRLDGPSVQFDADGDGSFEHFVTIGTLTSNFNTLTVTLNGNASDAAVAALTQAIRFGNDLPNAVTGTRTVTFTLNDGGGTANGGHDSTSFNVTVDVAAPVNAAPVISGTNTGTVHEDDSISARTITHQFTATDPDDTAAPTWTVDGGTTPHTAQYSFRIDEFKVTRTGTNAFTFDDSFDTGNAPSDPTSNAPNFSGGGAASYGTTGGFVESHSNGGFVTLDAAHAVITNGVGTAAPIEGNFATLQTNVTTGFTNGLRLTSDFTVEGTFDLINPAELRQEYGIRLTDRIGSLLGNDTLDLVIRNANTGGVAVQLRHLDQAGDVTTTLQSITLNPTAQEDHILLRLSHVANSSAITASFDLYAGSTYSRTLSFTTTDNIFHGEDFTRASFFAASPNPSISYRSGNYGTLSIDSTGAWTYSLNNGSSAVQSLAENQTVHDIFTVDADDGHPGGIGQRTIDVSVVGVNDAPVVRAASGDSAGTATPLPETNLGLSASGTSTVNDPDINDTVTLSVSQVSAAGPTGGIAIPLGSNLDAVLKGFFSVTAGPLAANPSDLHNVNWSFNSGSEAFNYLAAGDTLTLTYTIRPADGRTPTGTGDGTVTIRIAGANDAPSIDAATLEPVAEDTSQPLGQKISTIFFGKFHDIDHGSSFAGIAVVANHATPDQGVWQYKSSPGRAWEDVGTATASEALAFDANTLLRFVPAADFNGTPGGLEVRGLDDTYDEEFTIGQGGGGRYTINTTNDGDDPLGHGGSTAISDQAVTLSTSVTPVNAAPVVTAQAAGNHVLSSSGGDVPGRAAYQGVLASGLGISSDSSVTVEFWLKDSTEPTSMAVGFFEYDLLIGNNSDGTSAIGFNTGQGDLAYVLRSDLQNQWHHITAVFVTGNAQASKLYIDGILQTLQPSFPENGFAVPSDTLHIGGWGVSTQYTLAGQIDDVSVWHGERTQTEITADMQGSVTGPQPGLVASYSFENVSNGTGGVIDNSGNGHNGTLSTLTSANVIADSTVRAHINEDHVLVFSNANHNGISVSDSDSNHLTVTLSVSHGSLTVTTSGLTVSYDNGTTTLSGPTANINAALEGLSYQPDLNYNGADALVVTVSDGTLSDTKTIDIAINPVNDAPVLDLDSSDTPDVSTNYSSNLYNDGNTFPIATAPTVTDADAATLTGARVVLTNSEIGDFFTLGSTDSSGTLASGIDWIITGTAGVSNDPLTVTFSGSHSAADYAYAIQQVSFGTTSSEFSQRHIEVTVNDGTEDSNVAVATIEVSAAPPDNNAPVAGDDSVTVASNYPSFLTNTTYNDFDPDDDTFYISGAAHDGTPASFDDSGNVYKVQGLYGTLLLYPIGNPAVTVGGFDNVSVNPGDYIFVIGKDIHGDALDNVSAIEDLQPGQSLTDEFTYTITDSNNAQSAPATITITLDPGIVSATVKTADGYDTTTLWADLHNGSVSVIDEHGADVVTADGLRTIHIDAKNLTSDYDDGSGTTVLTGGLIKGFHVSDSSGALFDETGFNISAAGFQSAIDTSDASQFSSILRSYAYSITGGPAADVLRGGDLADRIDGGGGADVIEAGGGNDLIVVGSNAAWNIDGGTGIDTLEVSVNTANVWLQGPSQQAHNIEIFDLNKTTAATFFIDPPDAATLNGDHVARILGNSEDTVNLGNDFPAPNGVPGGHWAKTPDVMYPNSDVMFDKYEYQDRGGTVQETLYIEQGVVVNHQPVANPDNLIVSSDAFEAPGTFGHPTASLGIDNSVLLANDTDEDVGQTSNITGYSSQPTQGTLDFTSHIGTTFYDLNVGVSLPGTNQSLSDVFSYVAHDGGMNSNAAQVHLKIIGANPDASHTLQGTTGNEIFLGGQGHDTFVFSPGMGQDTVVNFDNFYHSVQDTIQLDNFSTVPAPTGLGNVFTEDDLTTWKATGAIQTAGNDVLIHLDGPDTLLLTNTTIAHLHASDFIVHPLVLVA